MTYAAVSISVHVCGTRVRTDEGECIRFVCVLDFIRLIVCTKNMVHLTRPGWASKPTPTVQHPQQHGAWRISSCVLVEELMGRQMTDSSDSEREALW